MCITTSRFCYHFASPSQSFSAILQILLPVISFEALVLVEPLLSPQGLEPLYPLQRRLIQSAYDRRDVWSSHAEALQYFNSKEQTKHWDAHVLELYVVWNNLHFSCHNRDQNCFQRFGLKLYRGPPHGSMLCGVSLACSREEEAVTNSCAIYQVVLTPLPDRRCTGTPRGLVKGWRL